MPDLMRIRQFRGATTTPSWRGDVAGVVMGTYDGRRGRIHRWAVDPDHRREGLATRLVVELRFWQALG